MMTIGSVIRSLRRKNHMTQEQLAEALGITSRAVSQWECGNTAPDLSQIPPLCHLFGVTSDTLDSTGELSYGGNIPTVSDLQSVLPNLVGDVMQMPPKYSAKNINGKRGYELARAGVEFELSPKQVRIESIDCLGKSDNENAFLFRIKCGGGTYIRSIARDMAALLDTQAVMSSLRREQSGIFTLENAVPYALLEQDLPACELEKYIIKTDSVLPYPTLTLTEKQESRFYNGAPTQVDEPNGLYKIYNKDGFYGIAQVQDGNVKIKTKLC